MWRSIMYLRIMKQLTVFLFLLGALGCAAAEDPAVPPIAELQTIVEMFGAEQGEAAFTQFQNQETNLIALVEQAGDAQNYTLLGRAYFYTEQDAKALKAFEAALQRDPKLATAYCFTGLIHRYANDFERAEAAFRKAVEFAPDNAGYYLELGRTLDMNNAPDGALPAYKKAIELEAGNFDAHYNLAVIYADKDNFENTEKHFLAAIKAKPDDLDSHYNLGQLYQNNKKHRAAIAKFEKVMTLNPNEAQALAKLVQENAAINDNKARDMAVERIYKLWSSGQDKAHAEQGFYIREQFDFEQDRIFVLEYFELKGERAKKYVFKRQNQQTKELMFDVSLGSYEHTTKISREIGDIGPDDRLFHMDGYAPDGSHYTYGFYMPMPTYDTVKEIALKAFSGEQDIVSSMTVTK